MKNVCTIKTIDDLIKELEEHKKTLGGDAAVIPSLWFYCWVLSVSLVVVITVFQELFSVIRIKHQDITIRIPFLILGHNNRSITT